jgi:hypothetical protein
MKPSTFGALAVIGLVACDDPTQPPGPAATVAPLATSADDDDEQRARHFRSSCQTSFTFTSPTTLHIDYDCKFRGLGKRFKHATGSVEQTLGPNGAVSNVTVYTFKNGDQLFATFAGTGSPPDANGVLTFTGAETFTGGTGRFAHASGTDALAGSASLISNTGQFETRGVLTLDSHEADDDDHGHED